MTNFPPSPPVPLEQLHERPGRPKPEEADAVGEGDVEELSQQVEASDVEEQERRTQLDNARAIPREPSPDLRRRFREARRPGKGTAGTEVEGP